MSGILKRIIAAAAAGAAMLLSGTLLAHAADGSNAWGASLPEYAKVKSVNVVSTAGADSSGKKDSSTAFQNCLDLAMNIKGSSKCVEIFVPAGTYNIGKGLKIYSNTRMICEEGTVIRRAYDGGAILSTAELAGGYDGTSNILIQGGTWDGNVEKYGGASAFSNIRIGHANNILLRGMNIINNKNGHHIEIGGAYGVTIDGCSFSGYYGSVMKEAIQLDVMNCDELFTGYPPFDDTACDNILIRGCTFTDIPRAIGSHSAVAGVYYTNVTITDNVFTGMSNFALFLYNYKHCTIKNNTFDRCGAGILFNHITDESFRHYFPSVNGLWWSSQNIDANADTVIEGNTIDTVVTPLQQRPFGIKLYGANMAGTSNYPAANYYMTNIAVKNNTITSAYSGIIMNDIYSSTISGNIINGKPDGVQGYLISADYCFDTRIKGNTVGGSLKSGLSISNSSGMTAEGNSFSDCTDVGVLVSSSVDCKVNKNSYRDNALGGIKIADGSAGITCSENVIRGGNYALKVDGSGSGKDIKLKNNDISSASVGMTCVNGGMAYMVGNSFEAVGRKISEDEAGLITLSRPRSFEAEEITSDRIKLTWKAVGEAEGINVYRKRAGYGEFELIASGDSGSIFQDERLEPGTNYIYKVVPFIYVGENAAENTPSEEIGARTKISMESAEIDCAGEAGFTARPVAPRFSVTANGRELLPGIDYDFSYGSNLYAGTATLTVTGKGNYIGTQTVNYEIKLGAPRLSEIPAARTVFAPSENIRRYEVTAERLPDELLAVGSERVNPIQRAIDSLSIQDSVKITARERVWNGTGFFPV